MTEEPTVEQMNCATEYRVLRDRMRLFPVVLMCAAFVGIAFFSMAFADPLARRSLRPSLGIVACACVLAAGIRLFARPRRAALYVEAYLWVALGSIAILPFINFALWGVLLQGFLNFAFWGVLLQRVPLFSLIAAGIFGALAQSAFSALDRLRKLPLGRPEPAWLAWADQIVRDIRRANPRRRPDMLTLKVGGATWRGRLLEKAVMFLVPVTRLGFSKTQAIVAGKDEVNLVPREGSTGKQCSARLNLGQPVLEATVELEFLRRFRDWKLIGAAETPQGSRQRQNANGLLSKPSPSV
ncbi:MAG: hypothetical protein ACUVUC_14960 [Thermoguttaceae bacterium]